MITKNKPSLTKRFAYAGILIAGMSLSSARAMDADNLPSLSDIKKEAAYLKADAKHLWADFKQSVGFDEERDEVLKVLNKGTKAVHKKVDQFSQNIKDAIKPPSMFEKFKRKVARLFS